MLAQIPYYPGLPPSKPEPLDRYLPIIPEGVATNWLEEHYPNPIAAVNLHRDEPRGWVLDPFGASPRLVGEIARAGYCVLVAANNPINRFLIEMEADPPTEEELRFVLAELATSNKGTERIELHIRSLYQTQCDNCKNTVQADAFLWERGSSTGNGDARRNGKPILYGRIYQCHICGEHGEHPVTELDIENANKYSRAGLHRARALERVVELGDPDRHHAEEAISVYLPRALYALITLINRIDGLNLPDRRLNHLNALLLTTLDLSNSLWPHPVRHSRPLQLKSRPRFLEHNIWLALENSIANWTSSDSPVPLTIWPELPPTEGGICLFEGRLKDLVENLEGIDIRSVVTAFPRPNQAFWTLSALWSGWLWGREAVGPFKSVLRRRRYDWAWHCSALQAALKNLSTALDMGVPMFGLISETEPAFLSAALIAAAAANFDLLGIALLAENRQSQITWHRSSKDKTATSVSIDIQTTTARRSGHEYIQQRGEPANYLQIHSAALETLAKSHFLPVSFESSVESISKTNTIMEEAFTHDNDFERIAGSEKSLDVGFWWLNNPINTNLPLADRVEMELVRYLIKHPGAPTLDIATHIYSCFPGLMTPDSELIQVCLDSYGNEDPPGSGNWKIRVSDLPSARRYDLENITILLKQVAHNLGYQVEDQTPLIWRNAQGEIRFVCYSIVSGVIGEILLNHEYPAEKSLLVLPGGRSNLVVYKLAHNPRLQQVVDMGWRFIKFRQVRWLAKNPVMNEGTLNEQLTKDPLRYDIPQMPLF